MGSGPEGHGGGLTLWALHGAFGTGADWDGAGRWLGGGIEVRALDLWASVVEGDGWEGWATRMAGRIKAEGRGRNVLLGYSMGGRLALALLAAAEELWSGAIIVSAHPGLAEGDTGGRAERAARDSGWLRALGELGAEEFLGRWEGQGVFGGGTPDEGWRQARRSLLRERGAELGAAFSVWSLAQQPDYRAMLKRPGPPILWVTGGLDPKFCGLAAEVVVRNPRVLGVVVEGAGHRVPWERPEEFWRECRRFLGWCGGPERGGDDRAAPH